MLFNGTAFIGIDIPGIRLPLTYCALDDELNLLALRHGGVDDVLAFVNGQDRAYVAINAPRTANKGLMQQEDFRAGLNPRPRPGRWERWRVAEYQLRQHRIKIRRTPMNPERAPGWMKLGFSLYRSLHASGFPPFRISDDTNGNMPSCSIECYAHAAFTALLEHLPLPRSSFLGRIQRQLVLYVNDMDLPNPMQLFEEITRYRLLKGELMLDDLLEPTHLDALCSAFTARAAARGQVTLFGDPEEGQIVVPVPEMMPKYA